MGVNNKDLILKGLEEGVNTKMKSQTIEKIIFSVSLAILLVLKPGEATAKPEGNSPKSAAKGTAEILKTNDSVKHVLKKLGGYNINTFLKETFDSKKGEIELEYLKQLVEENLFPYELEIFKKYIIRLSNISTDDNRLQLRELLLALTSEDQVAQQTTEFVEVQNSDFDFSIVKGSYIEVNQLIGGYADGKYEIVDYKKTKIPGKYPKYKVKIRAEYENHGFIFPATEEFELHYKEKWVLRVVHKGRYKDYSLRGSRNRSRKHNRKGRDGRKQIIINIRDLHIMLRFWEK